MWACVKPYSQSWANLSSKSSKNEIFSAALPSLEDNNPKGKKKVHLQQDWDFLENSKNCIAQTTVVWISPLNVYSEYYRFEQLLSDSDILFLKQNSKMPAKQMKIIFERSFKRFVN